MLPFVNYLIASSQKIIIFENYVILWWRGGRSSKDYIGLQEGKGRSRGPTKVYVTL